MLIPAVLRAERLELRLLSLRVMACMMHSTGTGSSSGSGGSGGRGRVFFFRTAPSRYYLQCSQNAVRVLLLVARAPQAAPQLWLQHAARRVHTKGCCDRQPRRQQRCPCARSCGR